MLVLLLDAAAYKGKAPISEGSCTPNEAPCSSSSLTQPSKPPAQQLYALTCLKCGQYNPCNAEHGDDNHNICTLSWIERNLTPCW